MTTPVYTQHTWATLVEYMTAMEPRADPASRQPLYLLQANIALDLISQASGGIYGSSTSGVAAGDITLTGANAVFPIHLRELESVFWNGGELRERDAQWLDRRVPGWRSSVGNPTYFVRTSLGLVLDAAPGGGTAGLLVVWGLGALPHFSTAAGKLNPCSLLPMTAQMAPAYYVLAMLPLPKRPQVAQHEVQLMLRVREDHKQLWRAALDAAASELRARRHRPMSM